MSKFRVRSKWAPYVDSTAKEKKKNDLSLSKGPLSIFDTCLVCSAALTWSLPQKQVLLGGKVRLALAEQHGKAHILFQGAALALLDQVYFSGWNKEQWSGVTVQSSSPTNVQAQAHELPSVGECDTWSVLKSEKLMRSLVLVQDPLMWKKEFLSFLFAVLSLKLF